MAMNDQSAVVSTFELRSQADAAVYELQQSGFSAEQISLTDASGRTLVTVQTADRQEEAETILHHNGGYEADSRFVEVQAEPTIPVAEPTNTNESSHEYDPIRGVNKDWQPAPVSSGEFGMKRDPSVETDATAGTLNTQSRPDPRLEDGSDNSIFERPIAPGTVQPGTIDDPNNRGPRIP